MHSLKMLAAAGVFLAACTPTPTPPPPPPPMPGPIIDAGIGFGETACFGTCPDYSITVYPNEFYELRLGRFTRAPGTNETGTLPAGSFAAANAALNAANFAALPTDVTLNNPADCPPPNVSDLPSAMISETTIAGTRVINYYPGCFGAPSKPALDQLSGDLRTAFGLPALVQ